MATLVYKRTHHGDPCRGGIFGCYDCMGRVRTWTFDSVIGIGGLGPEAERSDIAGRVNWIGVGAIKCKKWPPGYRGPLVRFARFKDYGTEGPVLCEVAESLAEQMYAAGARARMRFNRAAEEEIAELLALVRRCAPSPSTCSHRVACGSRRC